MCSQIALSRNDFRWEKFTSFWSHTIRKFEIWNNILKCIWSLKLDNLMHSNVHCGLVWLQTQNTHVSSTLSQMGMMQSMELQHNLRVQVV